MMRPTVPGRREWCKEPRATFTLIEALVVIAAIGMIASLLLVAIQAAREAARRVQCAGNLKQIGLALHNYEATMSVFPRGEKGFSPHAMLLPYLEQTSLYDSLNFAVHSSEWESIMANFTSSNVQINEFLCPSDAPEPAVKSVTSYAANNGVGFEKYGAKPNGPFSWKQSRPGVGFRMITDGTSQTAAMAEWLLGAPIGERDARRSTFKTPVALIDETQFEQFSRMCHDLDISTATMNGPSKGSSWLELGYGLCNYNHNLPPNDHTCKNKNFMPQGAWTSGSMHPGGANVVFTDGHVSFHKDSITWGAWRALGSMNGGELITE